MGLGTRASQPVGLRNGMGVNLRGHSFTTRFLFGVLQKAAYKHNHDCFSSFLDAMMENFLKLYYEGLNLSGRCMRFVVLGIKGDLPFLGKAGHLVRTFLNVRKAPETSSSKLLEECCHMCLAGTKEYCFEDFSCRPGWLQTTGHNNPYPWKTLPPHLEYYPHVRTDPGSFFRLDVLHIYHLGMGRDFVASSLVQCLQLYDLHASSIPEGVALMNSDLHRFLKIDSPAVAFQILDP